MLLFGKAVFVTTSMFVVFLICWCSVVGKDSPANSDLSSDAWVDPGDMLSTDLSSFGTVRFLLISKINYYNKQINMISKY